MLNKNFTRKELTNKVHKNLGFSKNISANIIDNFFESLVEELILSNKVKISSFGTFEILNKKERVGRNPKTNVTAKITARKIVKFKPSQIIKKKINKNES